MSKGLLQINVHISANMLINMIFLLDDISKGLEGFVCSLIEVREKMYILIFRNTFLVMQTFATCISYR